MSSRSPATMTKLKSRRTSLPAVFHAGPNMRSPKSLSPKLGFLKEISEFEIDPPFLSPASSSSSADNSPMMLSPAGRPASARLYRRRNKLPKDFPDTEDGLPPPSSDFHRWMAEDDFFGSPISPQRFLHNAGGDLAGLTPPSSRCSPSSGASSSSPTDHAARFRAIASPAVNRQLKPRNCSPRLPTADSLNHDEEEEEDDSNLDLDVLNLRNALKARTNRMAKYQQMRSFNVDSQGRIVDCGFRNAGGKLLKPVTRNNKNRRATCPEIWLSTAEEDERHEVTKCVLRLYGCATVGKKSVARQLFASADVVPLNDVVSIASDDLQKGSRTVSFLMNESEIEMEITQGSNSEVINIDPLQNVLTVYMVCYSVDNRDSFTKAAQILYRLYDRRLKSSVPLILVANKADLQRKRRVTSIEGKMLSKIYKCPFVEISAMLSMNVDSLWNETLKKLQKHKSAREKAQEKGDSDDRPDSSYGERRKSGRFGKILDRTRRFAKSCEEIVARIAAL